MHLFATRNAANAVRQPSLASVSPSTIAGELLAVMPALTGYARALAGNRADSDDLVQDAMVSMLAAAARFEQGTNFRAWAFTILRNRFLSDFVVKRRRTICIDDVDLAFASTRATQADGLECEDLRRHFAELPAEAQALLALAADGATPYDEIAARDGSAVGTVKSRVHRARAQLRRRLDAAYSAAG
jgi:RNA polymerase sigma-70 factor (ECF subfamily)